MGIEPGPPAYKPCLLTTTPLQLIQYNNVTIMELHYINRIMSCNANRIELPECNYILLIELHYLNRTMLHNAKGNMLN